MSPVRPLGAAALLLLGCAGHPAATPSRPATAAGDPRIHALAASVAPDSLERTVRHLVAFGTRHTLSDTLSTTRGIGAARRWVKSEFDRISAACGGCLEVRYQARLVPGGSGERIPRDAMIVNVVAVQRGTRYPARHLLMTAHLDSRASDAMDDSTDAPGANDDASGVAAVLEAARVLSRQRFDKTIVYAALSGEEQGLFGGTQLAELARDSGWTVEAVLNNDVVGNRMGGDGVPNGGEFRVFSEPVPATETEQPRRRRRFSGGEVDGPSRQLARYVERMAGEYVPGATAVMIYRLDRFGRGGDHRPFNDLGFPAVRLTEMHEDYTRQHQDVRTEGGVAYGDVVTGMSFPYLARVTRANVASLAGLAWAPPPPVSVRIAGAVSPHTVVSWIPADTSRARFRVYWRATTAPQWEHSRSVTGATVDTLRNIVIDNWLFGVAAVDSAGHESVVVFP